MKGRPGPLFYPLFAYVVIIAALGAGLYRYKTKIPKTVRLHWVASAQPVLYRIYRSDSLAGVPVDSDPRWHQIGVTELPDYEDKDVQPGHTYWYCTRAESRFGLSPPSNFVTVTVPN